MFIATIGKLIDSSSRGAKCSDGIIGPLAFAAPELWCFIARSINISFLRDQTGLRNFGKRTRTHDLELRRTTSCCLLGALCVSVVIFYGALGTFAQNPSPSPAVSPDTPVKANARPAEPSPIPREPFDGASVDNMASQCVLIETEAGSIEIEMMPEVAPESVRNFLNLAATGALDTTTFSRVVKNFVIQGGNLATSEKWSVELSKRAARKLPDEPGLVKHVRGIVSMARTGEPNSASTHFFILVGAGSHLDAKFAAFGRVRKGIEVADTINSAPTDGEKPLKPVRINRAVVSTCPK